MESYYTESMGLKSVTIDSVRAFNSNVDNYVTMYPSETFPTHVDGACQTISTIYFLYWQK